MNRRDFMKVSAAATAVAAVSPRLFAQQSIGVFQRTVHFMYDDLISQFGESYNTLTPALDLVTNKVTCLCPLFLNTPQSSLENNTNQMILTYVQNRGITFTPAVGGPGPGNQLYDYPNGPNCTILQGYHAMGLQKIQPYLRIENLSGFFTNTGGDADIRNFMNYAVSLGFTQLILNPWPQNTQTGAYMNFSGSPLLKNIAGCFQNAEPTSFDLNASDIANIQQQAPGTPIIVNYESGGSSTPQAKLYSDSYTQDVSAFNETLSSISSYSTKYPGSNITWAPPFTGSYDPLKKMGGGSNIWQAYMVPKLENNA